MRGRACLVVITGAVVLSLTGCAPPTSDEVTFEGPLDNVGDADITAPSKESGDDDAAPDPEADPADESDFEDEAPMYPHEAVLHATGNAGDTADVTLRLGDPVPGDTVMDPVVHACDDYLSSQVNTTLARTLAIPVQIEVLLTSSMQAQVTVNPDQPRARNDATRMEVTSGALFIRSDQMSCLYYASDGAGMARWTMNPGDFAITDWWVLMPTVITPDDPTGLAGPGMSALGFNPMIALPGGLATVEYEPGPGVVSCEDYRMTYLTVNEEAAIASGCTPMS